MQQWYQCPRCGAQVAFGVGFCGSCQTPLNWPTQQQSPPPQYQQPYQQPQHPPQYQQQPEPPKKKSSKLGIILLAIILLPLAVVGSCLICVSSSGTPAPEPTDIGSEATIQAPDLNEVFLTIDKQADDEWTKACIAKDYIGMAQMEAVGKVFAVPNGTKVLVIGSGFATRQVRILEGDAFGKSGWLPYEWLK